MTTYCIRRATQGDLDGIVELRLHAEAWLRKRGIDQWNITHRGVASINERMDAETMYAIDDAAGSLVGTVTLDGVDLDFWTPEEAQTPALYLYKLMIHSDHRGRGLGDAILDWSCANAEDQGLPWLRIDVWKTNRQLHEYYLNRGFEYVRTASAPNRNSGTLFQRPTTLRIASADGPALIDTSADARSTA